MGTRCSGTDDPGPPAEVVHFRQAQTGGREILNALMERQDGLVDAVVRRQVLGDLPYAEALWAGRIGLWRAVVRGVIPVDHSLQWSFLSSSFRSRGENRLSLALGTDVVGSL